MSEKRKMNNDKSGSFKGPGPGGGGGPGGHSMMMSGEKAKNFKGTLKRLINYLKKYNLAIIVVFIFAIASSVFAILGPKILGQATTTIFEGLSDKIAGGNVGIDFEKIAGILITLIILYGLSSLFSYIQGYMMSGVSMKVTYQMRRDISLKINKMPLRYFDGTNHGEVLSRITNDVDAVSQTLTQSLTQLITAVTTIVGVLVMMLTISWLMTVVAVLTVPVSMIFVIKIVKKSQKYFKKQQKFIGHINSHVEEMYGGHVIVKAFNGEKESIDQFEELNEQLYGTAWKAQFLSSLMMPSMKVVGNIGYVAVCVLGGALAARRVISVGDIQAFIQYVRNFTRPISQLANISNVLQRTIAAAERVFEFLDEDNEVDESENPVELSVIKGDVEFKNVHFGYVKDKIIINDFSAKITPGQRVAIVGPTGAGKTTIVKLLMRFYDVSSGSILLDGNNIEDFRRNDLRNNFGMVLQDTWLYNDTIMNNIRYGRLDATDEEVIEAAKKAHVDSFVHMLPAGYNLVLNEEANNISAGQKQLITIARAILANPKLLIFDEATSSVDTRTEMQVQKAMENLMEDKTSFIIAHRLSTIRDADMILVMNDGDIVEQGNHEELLSANGFYANLYNSQFEQ